MSRKISYMLLKVKEVKIFMEKLTIGVINGPNINILGIREKNFYGNETWANIEQKLESLSEKLNVEIIFYQSNHEGDIVDFIQENMHKFSGVIINPAAYTKTGYAILDALTAVELPFVEVHISNIFSRGGWHAKSIFASHAIGHIIGFKGYSYQLGVRALVNYINS